MVMIKLVRKEGVKNVKNDFMFMKLANIVLNVLGKYKNEKYLITVEFYNTKTKYGIIGTFLELIKVWTGWDLNPRP